MYMKRKLLFFIIICISNTTYLTLQSTLKVTCYCITHDPNFFIEPVLDHAGLSITTCYIWKKSSDKLFYKDTNINPTRYTTIDYTSCIPTELWLSPLTNNKENIFYKEITKSIKSMKKL